MPILNQPLPMPTLLAFAFFFFLIGACVGSFLNVVIWRLPYRGREVMYLGKRARMTLSWPPSHCPMCDAPIHWYQNIPVASYAALRGKCGSCRAPIPIRYPLVELGTAIIWSGLFLAYFVGGWQVPVFSWQHGTGLSDFRLDWPPYVLHALLASALLAASAIDADLFIIPLSITWCVTAMGILAAGLLGPPCTTTLNGILVAVASFFGGDGKTPLMSVNAYAVIPALGKSTWWLAKPIVGAIAGLVLVNVLMAMKLIPRSFASEVDAPVIEGEADPKKSDTSEKEKEEPLAPPPKLSRFGPAVWAVVILMAIMMALWVFVSAKAAAAWMLVGGVIIFLIGVLPRDEGQIDVTDEVMQEISMPHVRREMGKELLFLAVPVACALLVHFLPIDLPQVSWLARVLGSLLGFLVGGGIVWMIRVLGSLAFNKEAMGMGDAHLMAAVGAVVGAPLVLVAFFVAAPFLGIIWAIVLKFMGKPNVLPYGPWLSVASILALVMGNSAIAFYLSLL